ncbi:MULTISPECIES: SDR family oxidoreductase [unclassified Inquilinus]|uniref:SDR family oxidoreductase n=1 Tax=unclassified Inquilinus TaxID=2645927 RepID=UPI003F8EBF76
MRPHNAAEGAMVNLTRTLALGLARRDIRVNSVCPSLTHTSKIKGMLQDEVLVAKFEQRIPFGIPSQRSAASIPKRRIGLTRGAAACLCRSSPPSSRGRCRHAAMEIDSATQIPQPHRLPNDTRKGRSGIAMT